MRLNIQEFVEQVASRVADKVGVKIRNDGHADSAPRRLLSMKQAASYIGRSQESVQHMISERRFPVVRSDRRVFVDVKDLDEWIEANKHRA